jgi:ABC-type Fe3+-hydroxamate transport system substrate-binding protein
LNEQVIGITKFCVHPEQWLRHKQIIGGTKNFSFDVIEALKPDLIIGNKEENYKEGIDQLKEKYPVWMSDIFSLTDSIHMIGAIGVITDKVHESDRIIQHIQQAFSSVHRNKPRSVLYLIWKRPWMAVASDTFIDAMLTEMGLRNCLQHKSRYPELSDDDIAALKPDVIFLSSEPFPFKERHIEELKRISPSSMIKLVDGEMFSWYGSRLIQAPAYFNSLILP